MGLRRGGSANRQESPPFEGEDDVPHEHLQARRAGCNSDREHGSSRFTVPGVVGDHGAPDVHVPVEVGTANITLALIPFAARCGYRIVTNDE